MKKIDQRKVYAFIGQALVYTTMWAISVAGTVWAVCQNSIY